MRNVSACIGDDVGPFVGVGGVGDAKVIVVTVIFVSLLPVIVMMR